MPGMNGTGPMGEGAMTGRRMGRCTHNGAGSRRASDVQNVQNAENVQNPEARPLEAGMGRGLGRGLGRGGKGLGMGRRNRFRNGN